MLYGFYGFYGSTAILIVIDGIDGSGKTTQTEILVKRLKKTGYQTATLDFPQYHQFFGKMVKNFLNGDYGSIDQVDPHLASVLYALDRWQTRDKLNHWLKSKKIVILNRYTTSNLIHQAIKINPRRRNRFVKWIETMEYEILGLPKPDFVLYLYLPARLSYALITKRGRQKDIHEADINHLKQAAAQGKLLTQTRPNWHLIKCHHGDQILTRAQITQKIMRFLETNI